AQRAARLRAHGVEPVLALDVVLAEQPRGLAKPRQAVSTVRMLDDYRIEGRAGVVSAEQPHQLRREAERQSRHEKWCFCRPERALRMNRVPGLELSELGKLRIVLRVAQVQMELGIWKRARQLPDSDAPARVLRPGQVGTEPGDAHAVCGTVVAKRAARR